MEEIKIIKKQLAKLAKKGYHLDVINDSICLVATNVFLSEVKKYESSSNKYDPMKKVKDKTADFIDESKYIIASF